MIYLAYKPSPSEFQAHTGLGGTIKPNYALRVSQKRYMRLRVKMYCGRGICAVGLINPNAALAGEV
jgi:hypothetical protein